MFQLKVRSYGICPSANEWIKKLWYIYTMEFYTAERKKELIPFATAWVELESIMLSEISQGARVCFVLIGLYLQGAGVDNGGDKSCYLEDNDGITVQGTVHMILFSNHNSPMREALVIAPLYKQS